VSPETSRGAKATIVPVSAERLTYIRELANDERVHSVDTSAFIDEDWRRFGAEVDAETVAFCRNNSDAEELHAFVANWNWDKGEWGPEEVAGNPACEAATALLIYWSCGPEFYLQYANREEVPDFLVDGFDLLTAIEARYVAGEFLPGLIAFDPANPTDGLSMVGVYDDARDKFVRALPSLMYAPVRPVLLR
jgi:Domain of unknown function (DUF4274)